MTSSKFHVPASFPPLRTYQEDRLHKQEERREREREREIIRFNRLIETEGGRTVAG